MVEKEFYFGRTAVLNKKTNKNLFNTLVLNKLKITIILIQLKYAKTI